MVKRRITAANIAFTESEKGFQQAVVDLAKASGWLVFHDYDSRRNTPGFPDLVMVRDGQVIFAELKTNKGKLSKDQKEWGLALNNAEVRAGDMIVDYPFDCAILYRLWRPSDWPEIEWVLNSERT